MKGRFKGGLKRGLLLYQQLAGLASLRQNQIASALQIQDQPLDLSSVILKPGRLRQHVVDDVESARLEQRQGLVEMRVFCQPEATPGSLLCSRGFPPSRSGNPAKIVARNILEVPYSSTISVSNSNEYDRAGVGVDVAVCPM
jgi:hypothetical protein